MTRPHNKVIVLPQTLPSAKVGGRSQMMFAGARLHPFPEQQRDHHVRTVVAVHYGDIAFVQREKHRTQQR
jgi:hypothetical protein